MCSYIPNYTYTLIMYRVNVKYEINIGNQLHYLHSYIESASRVAVVDVVECSNFAGNYIFVWKSEKSAYFCADENC